MTAGLGRGGAGVSALGARMPALDGVRGFALLIMLMNHFFYFAPVERAPGDPAALDSLIESIRLSSWGCVDVFFALSGYLITRVLLEAKGSQHYFRNFYARRALRIVPLYYGFLFLLVAVLPLFPDLRNDADLQAMRDHQAWYWSYLFNVWGSIEPEPIGGAFRNGHFWTLSVEEQFYFVWPLVVLLLNRRALIVAGCCAIVGALAFRIVIRDAIGPEAAYLLMPSRVDSLAAGALVALVTPVIFARHLRTAWIFLAASLVPLAVLVVVLHELDPYHPAVQTIGFSSVAVFSAALLFVVIGSAPNTPLIRWFSFPPFRFVGSYSYGMYVLHLQLVVFANRHYFGPEILPEVAGLQLPSRLLYFSVMLAVTSGAAWLSWHLYEKQFLKLKDRFRSRERAPATPVSRSVSD